LLRDRQFFLLDAKGDAIGTMTAWFAKEDPRTLGRINWVALIPQSQGKGLSKLLMVIALHRLRELGHEKACAGTSTSRLAAINLNCQFGFVPDIRCDKDLKVWRELEPHLKRSVLPPSDDEARNLYQRTFSGKARSQNKQL
jgi:GNAT superfamily N-acetyltransferase